MNIDYSKLPDGHIIDGVALVSMKLHEAKCFMAEVTTARYKLGRCKKSRQEPAWSCIMGVYTLRIENLTRFMVEMKLLLQRLQLELKSRGIHDD
jgi:hypothetical protein